MFGHLAYFPMAPKGTNRIMLIAFASSGAGPVHPGSVSIVGIGRTVCSLAFIHSKAKGGYACIHPCLYFSCARQVRQGAWQQSGFSPSCPSPKALEHSLGLIRRRWPCENTRPSRPFAHANGFPLRQTPQIAVRRSLRPSLPRPDGQAGNA